jgi:hypothetical protein
MSEYTDQAEAFLTKHGLTFRAVFVEYAPYFPDDKEPRNVYTLTLSAKGRGRYTTRFGDSINNTRTGIKPNAYDLLTCITKYDPGSFADFCSEFGYDEDSRKAEKTYKAVKRDWAKVSKFFTPAELEELAEIQ